MHVLVCVTIFLYVYLYVSDCLRLCVLLYGVCISARVTVCMRAGVFACAAGCTSDYLCVCVCVCVCVKGWSVFVCMSVDVHV